jgi:hypothetical protein
MKDKSQVTTNGRAVFYAVLWEDFRKTALDLGWALALHGSMASDMDIMAMPWIQDASPVNELVKAISDRIGRTAWSDTHLEPHYGKPHGRIVYTFGISGDFYIDLSIICPASLISPIKN